MLKLANPDIKFPKPYPRVERVLSTANEKGLVRVGKNKLRPNIDFMPQPGLQEQLCATECNLVFICGQATSGKTFAMFLKSLGGIEKYGFTARLISVRLQDSKKGSSIFRDGVTICGNFAGCEYNASDYPTFMWPQWNSNLQLIHSNFNADNPSEWEQFQDYAKKQQSSLIMIDEATEIKQFKMFAYWFSRNRDASGMTPQMILSFNPSHDHWTTEMLRDAGYLTADGCYLRPEMISRVRYFYNKGNSPSEIIWGDTRKEVADKAGLKDKPEDVAAGITRLSYVKSFTVLTGTAADNRELVNATGGQSVANLHAVGATQRAIVGEAYFGEVEREEVNVNRQLIHQLWENPISDDENLYATMDVSLGRKDSDNSPLVIWRGLQVIDIKFYKGQGRIEDFVTNILEKYGIPITNFAYDATGVGGLMEQHLKQGAIGITANRRCLQEYDQNGNRVQVDEYFNLRSQLLGKTELMLKKGYLSMGVDKDLIIPYGKNNATRRLVDVLFDEMNVFTTVRRNKKIYYRSKDEYKAKFKSSPDLMDVISYRAIFELDTRERKQPKPTIEDDAYDDLYRRPPVRTWGRY